MKKYFFLVLFLLMTSRLISVALENGWKGASVDFKHGKLKVSENKRFLVFEDGSPFFYLGDTGWELFHRLDKAETQKYLEGQKVDCVIEECSDSEEACLIADNYDRIIKTIGNQIAK